MKTRIQRLNTLETLQFKFSHPLMNRTSLMQFVLPVTSGCHTISLVANAADGAEYAGQLYCFQSAPSQSIRKIEKLFIFVHLPICFVLKNLAHPSSVAILSHTINSLCFTDVSKRMSPTLGVRCERTFPAAAFM